MARRITPIAVDQPEGGQGLPAHSLAFEGPLDVGPAPDQGDVRAVHPDLGAGRRVWVDIQGSWQVKFKQVLRQQGLDYKAWEHEQKEKYEEHFKKLFGEDEKRKDRPNIIANIQRRMHEMMRPSDSDEDGESLNSEDDSDEEGDGYDDEGGEDGSSDDGEGGGPGEEIDLDKEEDKEQAKKPKRQRCERYEDDFIDDSEIERVKGGPKVKTLYSGFFINKGQIEVVEEPTKQRRRAPKPAAAEAAAAAGDGAGSGQPPPAKRRKQQEQQQQEQQQQEQQQQEQQPKQKQKQKEGGQQQQQEAPQAAKKRKKTTQGEPAAAAAAGEGSELSDAGGRKKRARGDHTEAAAEGDGAAAPPANKRARKASPATSDAAAAAAAAPPPSQLPPVAGSSAGKQGIAAAALAAALAAASKKPAAAGSTPAAALPPAGPGTARRDAAAAAGAGADTGTAGQAGAQQQQRQSSQDPQYQQEKPGKAAAAVCAVFPGASQAEAAAAGGEAAAAAAAGDGGVPAGLPEDVVAAAMALQSVVQEHDAAVNGPSANAASRKVITAPLSALGLAFASLPGAQQAQQEAQLLALVRPLLPHLTDRALRKKLLQEPRDKLGALQQHREAVLAALGDVKGAPGAGDGSASDDDFQQAWSTAAEDSLVAAWTAAKAAGGQASLDQLALDVCAALGNTAVQGQPAKAVAELQQVFRRAQKRHKEARAAEAAAKAAAAAAAGDETAGPDDADATPTAAAAAAPAEAAAAAAAVAGAAKAAAAPKRAASRQLSPAPSGTAAAVAAATPAGTPAGKQQPPTGSQDSDAGGEDGAADQPAAEAGTQAAKAEFSRWSAPSPRLERCLAAAQAAGASEEWLSEKYSSIRKGSTLGHQAFRILCCAGPAGCEVKDFRAVAEQHGLDCQLDDSAQGRRSLRQAIHTKALSSIVGITEADANKVALLGFPGVVSRPPKPPARAATPLQGGQPDGAAAGGEGAADAAAAE